MMFSKPSGDENRLLFVRRDDCRTDCSRWLQLQNYEALVERAGTRGSSTDAPLDALLGHIAREEKGLRRRTREQADRRRGRMDPFGYLAQHPAETPLDPEGASSAEPAWQVALVQDDVAGVREALRSGELDANDW